MARIAVALFLVIFCLFLHISCNEGRLIRNTRPRAALSARMPPELEDSYGTSILRPSYIETGNQWKPLEGLPPHRSITKYRTKPPPPHPKYQDVVYPQDYYSHSKYPPQSYPPTNFIANQTLLVSDYSAPPKIIQKKPKYHPGAKKHYAPQTQYQVYEENDDENDSPQYEASQNRFKYQEVIMGKPKLSSVPPPSASSRHPSTFTPSSRIPPSFSSPGHSSKRMPSSMGKGKHYHHLHYHDSEEEVLVEDGSSNYEISNGRRPYPRGSSSRYPSYVTSRRSHE